MRILKRTRFGVAVTNGITCLCLSLFLCAACLRGSAVAVDLSGFMELNYAKNKTEFRDASGTTTSSESDNFFQRYRLTMNQGFFPNLRMTAGGLFEKRRSTSETAGQESDSTTTRTTPSIDLTLSTPLYSAGTGYSRNEAERKSSALAPFTAIRENYYGRLGWRPEGFPTVDLQFSRAYTYDKERQVNDTVSDSFSGNARYTPVKQVNLNYAVSINDLNDRLRGNTTESLTQSGRATYSDAFWKKRISLHSTYEVAVRETKVTTKGAGEVSFQIIPFAGLSALDNTPQQGALGTNAALIDGDLTASSGINIGLVPAGGGTAPRNIGLDLFPNTPEVNTLFVWVDRELPAALANSFSWDIYISADNLDWTFHQTVSAAAFDPLLNRFEIVFATVASRHIKVAVSPLSPAVTGAIDFPNIFVTELQAFVRRPASEVNGKTSQTSHFFNMGTRTRILERPSLTHELSFFLSKSAFAPARYFLSNGLSAIHSFSRVFSGTARVSMDQSHDAEVDTTTYNYSASLLAVPFPTLNHTLVFGGQTRRSGGRESDSKSLFLNNTAELYKGIGVNLSGGISASTSETGEETTATILNAGASLVPNPKVSLGLNYADTSSRTTGGNKPETSSSTRTMGVSASYQPAATVYLSGSYSVLSQQDQPEVRQTSYSINWTPFPYGALHLNLSYADSFSSTDDTRARTFNTTLRWQVNRRTALDVSYAATRSETTFLQQDSEVFSSHLRVSF